MPSTRRKYVSCTSAVVWEELSGRFAGELGVCEPMKVRVDEGNEAIERVLLTVSPGDQKPGDVRRRGFRHAKIPLPEPDLTPASSP